MSSDTSKGEREEGIDYIVDICTEDQKNSILYLYTAYFILHSCLSQEIQELLHKVRRQPLRLESLT